MLLTRNCRITLAMGELLRKEADYMLVYVINRHGKPLMPCKPQKARKLLKEQKSKPLLCERREASFLTALKHGVS